jgi:zinc-binding in reverse transcriptase
MRLLDERISSSNTNESGLNTPHYIPNNLENTLANPQTLTRTITLKDRDDMQIREMCHNRHLHRQIRINFLIDPGIPLSNLHIPWKIQAPLKVTIFLWLMLQGKLLTAYNHIKRQWPAPPHCIGCHTQTLEDTNHLSLLPLCYSNIEAAATGYSTIPFQHD